MKLELSFKIHLGAIERCSYIKYYYASSTLVRKDISYNITKTIQQDDWHALRKWDMLYIKRICWDCTDVYWIFATKDPLQCKIDSMDIHIHDSCIYLVQLFIYWAH